MLCMEASQHAIHVHVYWALVFICNKEIHCTVKVVLPAVLSQHGRTVVERTDTIVDWNFGDVFLPAGYARRARPAGPVGRYVRPHLSCVQ